MAGRSDRSTVGPVLSQKPMYYLYAVTFFLSKLAKLDMVSGDRAYRVLILASLPVL